MRQSSRQTRRRLLRVQTSTLDLPVHLYARQRELMNERRSLANERRELVDRMVASSLECSVDDEGEVLGTEEGRDVGADEVETLAEPGDGAGEGRVDVELPASGVEVEISCCEGGGRRSLPFLRRMRRDGGGMEGEEEVETHFSNLDTT